MSNANDVFASPADFQQRWNFFLMRSALAPHYHSLSRLGAHRPHGSTIVDRILATGLYVELVSILDEGLGSYLLANVSKTASEKALADKIRRVENSPISDIQPLMNIRDRRNDLAHQALSNVSWPELQNAVNVVGTALSTLNMVQDTPAFEWFAEFGAMVASNIPDAIGEQTNKVGVKWPNGNYAFVEQWTETLMNR